MADNCLTPGIGFVCPVGEPPTVANCAPPGNIEHCPTPALPSTCCPTRKCHKYFKVSSDTVKSCFGFKDLAGVSKTEWKERVRMVVRRRGTHEQVAAYNAWSLDADGRVCFLWDKSFLEAAPGLYEADIYLDCKCCTYVCLRLERCKFVAYDVEHVVNSGCSICSTCGSPADECDCSCGEVPQFTGDAFAAPDKGLDDEWNC